jgi:hypothetical protein
MPKVKEIMFENSLAKETVNIVRTTKENPIRKAKGKGNTARKTTGKGKSAR